MSTYNNNMIPLSYTTPPFPSLYWPIRSPPGTAKYLYTVHDITRFTLYWTLITICGSHLAVCCWAVLMQFLSAHHRKNCLGSPLGHRLSAKNRRLLGLSPVSETIGWVWLVPVVYLCIGGTEALMAGSLVGSILGAVYEAGYFKMSTWTPLIWGIVNMLVLIVGSFRIQGGL